MKKIMVRLGGSVPQYKKLLENEQLPDIGLAIPDSIQTAKPYDPKEGEDPIQEWYYVKLNPRQLETMIDPYLEALNLGTDIVQQAEYFNINAIYTTNGRKLAFGRVSGSNRISENGKTLIQFDDAGVTVEKVSFAIDFSGKLDAYFDGADRIYFTRFSRAKPLFKGFDEFYQESWYDDKEEFLNIKFFEVGEIEPEFIGARDTQLIANIQASRHLDLEDTDTQERIRAYARKYPLSGVKITGDAKLKITTKEDLQCVLKLLNQRYFTSEITGEVLEAKQIHTMVEQKPKKIFNGVEV